MTKRTHKPQELKQRPVENVLQLSQFPLPGEGGERIEMSWTMILDEDDPWLSLVVSGKQEKTGDWQCSIDIPIGAGSVLHTWLGCALAAAWAGKRGG